jgi:DNA polymerase-3 subunit alpha
MAALLQAWSGDDKEKLYAREARRLDIRILPADINVSNALWTLDDKRQAIRKGLVSIAGVGRSAADSIEHAREDGPFTSLDNLIDRTDSRAVTGGKMWRAEGKLNGVLLKLYNAHALESIEGR